MQWMRCSLISLATSDGGVSAVQPTIPSRITSSTRRWLRSTQVVLVVVISPPPFSAPRYGSIAPLDIGEWPTSAQ
jgi:hypothetical protein